MKKPNSIVKYMIVLLVSVALLFCFIFFMTDIAQNYQQVGISNSENAELNILNQFLAIIVLFVMGFMILLPEKKRIGITQMMLLSYIVGLLSFEFISSLILIMHIPFTMTAVFIGYFIYVAVLYFFMIRKDKNIFEFSKDDMIKFVFWTLMTIMVGFAFSKVPINVLSFDSVEYRNLGEIYVREGHIVDYVIYQMSGHPFIPTLLNSIGYMFDFDYAYGLQNMFTFMSLLLFGYVLFDETRKRGISEKKSFWLAFAGFFVLASSFFVVYLGVCLVPNIFAGFFMFFMMYYMYKFIRENDTIDLALSFIFMVAFCFTRVEGPLVAVFIVAYFAHKKIKADKLLKYTIGLFAALLLWYSSFFLHVGGNFDSAFLTVEKSVLIVSLFLVLGIYIFLKDKYFKKFNDRLFMLYYLAVIIFSIGINIMDIEKFVFNLNTMFQNMFYLGMWFTAWFAVIIMAIVAIIISSKKDRFLEGIIPLFLILMLAIFAFRDNTLHINWSDSGNRMLMHVYPLIIFVISDNILSFFTPKRKQLNKE